MQQIATEWSAIAIDQAHKQAYAVIKDNLWCSVMFWTPKSNQVSQKNILSIRLINGQYKAGIVKTPLEKTPVSW